MDMEMERKAALLKAMQKLDAYREIQNEMGRTVASFNFSREKDVLEHFALNMPDVAVEFADEGVFTGKEAVEAIVHELIGKAPEVGAMTDIQLTTPVIEVADDLKTAKALWWCPGAGAIPQEGEDPKAIWIWGHLTADFIYKDNTWRIWHLHYYRMVKCSYEKGWVEDTSMVNRPNTPMHPLSTPGTYHNPYTPLSVRDGIPAAPLPYATYTEKDRNWDLRRNKDY